MPKYMVGCELNERYCQVSFYSEEQQEPMTLENVIYSVDGLYEKATRQGGEEAIRMLKDCIQRAISQFDEIETLVFAVPTLNMDVMKMLKGIGQRLGVQKRNVYVQDFKESFCNYMLCQPKELWQYEAALFDCDRHEVKACMLRKIKTPFSKGRDQFVTVDEVAKAQLEELSAIYPVLNVDRARQADAQFKQFIQGVFNKKLISSVFLVGEAFENSWYPQSLKVLCNGRRAFLGNNLYSRGACYAAYKQTVGYEDNLIYLDETKMMDQMCLRLRVQGKDEWFPIVPWGIHWYEADTQCELLLEDTRDIEIHIESLATGEMYVERISLEGLPKRGNYSLRVQLKVIFLDEKRCKISIKDLGFGEFFPATNFYVEKEIRLGGSDEQFNSLS